jgi:hypothetical protein
VAWVLDIRGGDSATGREEEGGGARRPESASRPLSGFW